MHAKTFAEPGDFLNHVSIIFIDKTDPHYALWLLVVWTLKVVPDQSLNSSEFWNLSDYGTDCI